MGKNTDKKTDAAKLAAKLAGDATIEQEVARHRQVTQLTTALEDFRVRKGLRQKDIAEKMGVSNSTVSRIEDSCDADLRLGDLTNYAAALGLNLSIFFEEPNLPAAEQIKHCVFKISELLEHLTELAKECDDDQAIVDGIMRFRGEVLFNFMERYVQSELDCPYVVTSQPPMKTDDKPNAKPRHDKAMSSVKG